MVIFLTKCSCSGGLSQSACLPACAIFTLFCISGPVVSPVGWVERPVLYKPDMFYGGGSLGFRDFSLFEY